MLKIKIQKNVNAITQGARNVASSCGIIAMAAATIIGMTELAGRQDMRIALQPAYAYAAQPLQQGIDASMRKEKEEVAHRPMSYGTTMRSSATSGAI